MMRNEVDTPSQRWIGFRFLEGDYVIILKNHFEGAKRLRNLKDSPFGRSDSNSLLHTFKRGRYYPINSFTNKIFVYSLADLF